MNNSADAAREQARDKTSGRFGEQNLADPGTHVLVGEQGDRVGAAMLQPGDTVRVWAFPQNSPYPYGTAGWQEGVVDQIGDTEAESGPTTQIVFTDGRMVRAMPYANAYRNASVPARAVLDLLGEGPQLSADQVDTLNWLTRPQPGGTTPIAERLRQVRDTESAAWMVFDQMMADSENASLQPNLITVGGTDQAVAYYEMAVMERHDDGWATAAVGGTIDSLDPDSDTDTDTKPLRRAVRVGAALRRRLADATAITERSDWPNDYLPDRCTHQCTTVRNGKAVCLSCSDAL